MIMITKEDMLRPSVKFCNVPSSKYTYILYSKGLSNLILNLVDCKSNFVFSSNIIDFTDTNIRQQ